LRLARTLVLLVCAAVFVGPVVLGIGHLAHVPYGMALVNSLVIAISFTVLSTASAALTGFAFARNRVWWKNVVFLLVLSTLMVPWIVTMIPQYVIFYRLHLIDTPWPWVLWGIQGTPLHSVLAGNSAHQTSGIGEAAASKHDGNGITALSMQTILSLTAEMKNKGAVMLTFCTCNAETLIFDSAAMAVAATQKLPLVCLVESSLDSPLDLPNQTASGPYIGADPTFYPRIPVDGCDVVGVFRVAQEAIRRAREGHGPAVIECLTARSSTKNESTRPSIQYLAQDPISFMEQYLRRRHLWLDDWPQSIIEAFDRQQSEVAASLENPADTESQFDKVYSQRPAAASAR